MFGEYTRRSNERIERWRIKGIEERDTQRQRFKEESNKHFGNTEKRDEDKSKTKKETEIV